ncbi:MAG: hypothetical protein K0B07_02565 [DPANN group archaeon]|nr:hypothetical protein [DPANN group archaeon]
MIIAAVVPVVGGAWHLLSGISGDGGVTSIDNGSGYIGADVIEGGGSSGSLPTGAIVMWSGSLATIPSGWTLCNGAGGTPNLTSRFVRGVADGVEPGATGGEDEHVLTIAEMPSHSHGTSNNALSGSISGQGGFSSQIIGYTASTGGSQPHNNMPAYYEVAFICKT